MKRWFAALVVIGLIWAIAGYSGLATQGTYQSITLDFRDDLTEAQLQQELATLAQTYRVTPHLNSTFSERDRVYVVNGTNSLLQSLRRSSIHSATESIDANYLYHSLEKPDDPDYGKQWNLRSINIEPAWDETKGSGVIVAVIDTGITQVPDLAQTKMVAGYDFVNDRVEATDNNGHGTHVAGTIAQSTNNHYGVAGIAYEASLMPLKVLDEDGAGTITDIAEAIRFAVDHDADIINLSLGGGGDAAILKEAIQYAEQKGVVVVAAAGNANTNAASFPARYPTVLAVSATDASGAKAPYSNFGAGVDLAAPGGSKLTGESGGILQETIAPDGSTFAAFEGTSMAAPHVAGVAALVRATGMEKPEEVRAILTRSAHRIAEDALNQFGAGLLDAGAAVKLAQQGNLDVKDFLRWLRDSGYLNLKFWFDGGAVALVPKLAMVLGSYLLAWFLRNYLPLGSWALGSGLVFGSAGLFILRGLYIFDLPQFPFRLLGSSLPELGSALQGSPLLNPIFASVLVPFLLIALLLGHRSLKWFAIGSTLGVAVCLAVSSAIDPGLVWLGQGIGARSFLLVNALLCLGLGYLAAKAAHPQGGLA